MNSQLLLFLLWSRTSRHHCLGPPSVRPGCLEEGPGARAGLGGAAAAYRAASVWAPVPSEPWAVVSCGEGAGGGAPGLDGVAGREICALQAGSVRSSCGGMASLGGRAGWVTRQLLSLSVGWGLEQRCGPALGELPVASLTQAWRWDGEWAGGQGCWPLSVGAGPRAGQEPRGSQWPGCGAPSRGELSGKAVRRPRCGLVHPGSPLHLLREDQDPGFWSCMLSCPECGGEESGVLGGAGRPSRALARSGRDVGVLPVGGGWAVQGRAQTVAGTY